jgi:peptidoglycan/xylan/chitin deacetylase (PgdA/CDA1 family)
VVHTLADAFEVSVDAPALNRLLYLAPHHIAEMSSGGMSIGNHTRSHPFRAGSLTAAALQDEIGSAQEVLAALTGSRPTAFAYPFGSPGESWSTVVTVLRDNGLECAVTGAHGCNESGTDLFRLARCGRRSSSVGNVAGAPG